MIRHFFIAFKIKSCDDNDFLFLQQIVLYFHLLIHSATASFTLRKQIFSTYFFSENYLIISKNSFCLKNIGNLNVVNERWNN